jgi:hypothetical protein
MYCKIAAHSLCVPAIALSGLNVVAWKKHRNAGMGRDIGPRKEKGLASSEEEQAVMQLDSELWRKYKVQFSAK